MAKQAPQPEEGANDPLSPEVATLLAMLALDAALWAWQRRRARMAVRLYGIRRELAVALDSDGGVKALAGRSVPRWLKRPVASPRRS